jgi:chemotaxis regulatin CheY-phosphate phosphatase CheZ
MSDEKGKAKSKLGFITSATEIQDKYEALLKETEISEKNWKDLLTSIFNFDRDMAQQVGALLKLGGADESLLDTLMNQRAHSLTAQFICSLGISISRIEQKVAKLEKSIEQLRLQRK